VLSYELRGANKISITAAQNGTTTGWKVTLVAADTQIWTPGVYSYQAYVTKSPDRYTLWSGHIEILADLSEAADNYTASVSHVRTVLAQLETAIVNYSLNPYKRIVIAGREKETWSLKELVDMRARYQYYLAQEIQAEKIAKGLDGGGRILTRFEKPR
jgi:hypothetical protein